MRAAGCAKCAPPLSQILGAAHLLNTNLRPQVVQAMMVGTDAERDQAQASSLSLSYSAVDCRMPRRAQQVSRWRVLG